MKKYIKQKTIWLILFLDLVFLFPVNAFASVDPLLYAYILFSSPIVLLFSVFSKGIYIKSYPGNASKIVEANKISYIGIGTINKNFQSTGAVVSPILIPGVHER